MRVAILISGGGSNMVALVNSMLAGDAPGEPVIVISNVPAAGGLAKAAELGIATRTIDHREFPSRDAFEDKLHDVLTEAGAEVICLAGFMRILTPGFVARWEGRILNIHPSLLPKYKGLHTHQRALDAGDAEAGCTVHMVTSALDDGPVLAQASVPILPDDTAETLAQRVLVQEHLIYPKALASFMRDP